MRPAQLSVDDLHFGYDGAVPALRGVSMNVQPGEFVSVLGPSGGGKSTLLRLMAGLSRPQRGHVRIDGRDAHSIAPFERRIGFVFQKDNLYSGRSVRFNIEYALRNEGHTSTVIENRVRATASALQISDLLDRMPSQLSGGQAQRVAIARALAREPSLFLLDEPLSSLDPPLRRALRDELTSRHLDTPTTTVFVTHDPAEAMVLSDTIAVLIDGVVQQHDRPTVLINRPISLAVARTVSQTHLNEIRALATGGALVVPDLELRLPFRGQDGDLVLLASPSQLRLDGAGARFEVVLARESGGSTQVRLTNGRGAIMAMAAGTGHCPAVKSIVGLTLVPGSYNLYCPVTGTVIGEIEWSGHAG